MSYSSEVLADSPLAYYRLGESSGTTMVDSSGNAHDGTYDAGVTLGGASLLAGDANTSLDLPGSSAIGATVAAAAWMQVTVMTAECWVEFDSFPTTEIAFMGRSNVAGANSNAKSWALGYYAGHFLAQVFVNNSSTGSTVSSVATRATGTKYHVVVTFDNTSLLLYLNGSLVGTTARSLTLNPSPGTRFDVGQANSNSLYKLDGRIDEVAFYGTALSAARIAAHYAAGTPAPASGSGALSLSGSGTAATTATGSGSLSLSGSGSGAARAAGTGSLSLVASGDTVPPAAASGTGSLSLSASGGAGIGVAGTGSLSLSGAGAATSTAAASGTGSLSLSAVGSATLADSGTGFLSLSATGAAEALYVTDTSNLLNGRVRRARGTSTVDHPASSTPSRVAVKYDKSVPYPPPTLVNGRPT